MLISFLLVYCFKWKALLYFFQPVQQLENSQSMKYQCDNCQFCCISPSTNVSYCGLSTQCNQSPLSNGLLVGISLLTIVIFSLALLSIYFLFRKRQLGQAQQPQIVLQSEQIQPIPSERPSPPNTDLDTAAEQEKKIKAKPQRESKPRKNRLSKFIKYTVPSNVRTQTQRGLR